MSVTLSNITTAVDPFNDIPDITFDSIDVSAYTEEVEIYTNTPAVMIPAKLNAMAASMKNWLNDNRARFICCMTLFWPNGKSFSGTGVIEGRISSKKKGKKGFGYDPIFIPDGYDKTFGEMKPALKISIDHRFLAYRKIAKFFH